MPHKKNFIWASNPGCRGSQRTPATIHCDRIARRLSPSPSLFLSPFLPLCPRAFPYTAPGFASNRGGAGTERERESGERGKRERGGKRKRGTRDVADVASSTDLSDLFLPLSPISLRSRSPLPPTYQPSAPAGLRRRLLHCASCCALPAARGEEEETRA